MKNLAYLRKAEEIRATLETAEKELTEIVAKDDTNHTLMFAVMNLKAAIKELNRSINVANIMLTRDDKAENARMDLIKNALGL